MFFSCLVSVPVDGKWGVWGKWTSCSKTCGGGYMSRSRTCNNPAPQNGGRPCQGPSSERTSCNDQKCPGRRCIDLIVIVCAAVSHSACEVGVKGGEVSNFQNLGEFYEHTSCSIKDGHNLAGEGGGEERWILVLSQVDLSHLRLCRILLPLPLLSLFSYHSFIVPFLLFQGQMFPLRLPLKTM